METTGARLRKLRNSIGISQKALAEMIGLTQSAINRYENDESEPVYKIIKWYADYFDVSLDYIFCRTDNPQGKLYNYEPDVMKEKMTNREEWEKFVEMCFQPDSPMNAKLKEAIINMVKDDKL